MNLVNLKIGKIVGSPSEKTWAQTHVFLPEDKEKKLKHGYLLTSLSLTALEKDLDIASFGKEVISRFHEIYYSSKDKNILKNLKKSIKALVLEFADKVEVEIASVVVVSSLKGKTVGYFAATKKASIYIFRENLLASIFSKSSDDGKAASGFLQNNDLISLGTNQFFNTVSLGTLKATLQAKTITETIETLSSIIHGHENNSKSAAVIFKLKLDSKKELQKPAEKDFPSELKAKKLPFKIKSFLTNISGFKEKIKTIKEKKGFYLPQKKALAEIRLKDDKQKTKAKKTTLTVALILIVLLVVSIVLGTKKKTTSQETTTVNMLFDEVNYKYEQATSLKELNPLRARLLLNEAKELIEQNLDAVQNKDEKDKVLNLFEKVKLELENVAKKYNVDKANIFMDLTLAKEGFKGSSWGVVDSNIYIFDKDKSTVLEVDVDKKSSQVVAGGEKLSRGKLLTASGPRLFIQTSNSIFVVNIAKTEIVDEVEAEDWGDIKTMVGFSSNVYLLDISKNEIWKYSGLDTGLSDKTSYLKKSDSDLAGAAAMTIDGSVWVLMQTGEVYKYIRGERDNFNITGLEALFAEDGVIYTNENLDNLYVLDKKNTRIVAIDKETGEYQSQYVWPGIAGVSALTVYEDKGLILLLAGERIYEIEMRK
ncbi:hypothetical protein ACFLZ1_00315 [Patescibacteria group bacterium]